MSYKINILNLFGMITNKKDQSKYGRNGRKRKNNLLKERMQESMSKLKLLVRKIVFIQTKEKLRGKKAKKKIQKQTNKKINKRLNKIKNIL